MIKAKHPYQMINDFPLLNAVFGNISHSKFKVIKKCCYINNNNKIHIQYTWLFSSVSLPGVDFSWRLFP